MAKPRGKGDAQPGDAVVKADAKIRRRGVPRRHVALVGLRDHRKHQRHRAGSPVSGQPPGGGFASRPSPPEDEERDRHRGRGPEQRQHEEVVRGDRAGDARLGQQEQGEVGAHPVANALRCEHRDDADQAGENQHDHARPVDPEVIDRADRRQPRDLLFVLDVGQKGRELVVGDEEDEHEAEVGEEGDLLDHGVEPAAWVGQHRDHDGHRDRDPDREAEDVGRLEDPRAGDRFRESGEPPFPRPRRGKRSWKEGSR